MLMLRSPVIEMLPVQHAAYQAYAKFESEKNCYCVRGFRVLGRDFFVFFNCFCIRYIIEAICSRTCILPQDESSPHNMKLKDHHMFTPFPPETPSATPQSSPPGTI